jgi:hypothetical protein
LSASSNFQIGGLHRAAGWQASRNDGASPQASIAGGVGALVDDMRAAMETTAAAKPAVPAGTAIEGTGAACRASAEAMVSLTLSRGVIC